MPTQDTAILHDIHFKKLTLYPKYLWSHLITQNEHNIYKFTQIFWELYIFLYYTMAQTLPYLPTLMESDHF